MTYRPVPHRLAAAGVLCLVSAASPAAIVNSSIADVGDMVAVDWTQQVLLDTGPVSVTTSVAPTGGHEGSFWLHETSRPLGFGNSTDVVANLFTGAQWNPAAQGAVALIDFALDARGLSSSGIGIATSGNVRPVIAQGGVVYSVAGTSTQVTVGPTWQTIHRLFSDSDNWIDVAGTPGVRPDFSAQGGVIHFGYRFELGLSCPTLNNTAGCNAAATQLGVDNFRVTVGSEAPAVAVPEPSSWGLLAVALAGLAWVGRRERR